MLMSYYNECRVHAENGLDELIEFLERQKDLIYTREIEKGCGKYGEDITCIEVEVLDEDMCVDFLNSYEFDEKGKFIE